MSFISLPGSDNYRLVNCSLAGIFTTDTPSDKTISVDIEIAGGRIAAIKPALGEPDTLPGVDCRGGMIWPAFIDFHTHIDKAHIWERAPNLSGDFRGAVEAMDRERERPSSRNDILRRGEFALTSAYVHGTKAIRTHVDARTSVAETSWSSLAQLREEWRGRIELQLVSAGPSDLLLGETGRKTADLVERHGGLLGCVLRSMPDLDERVEAIFRLAKERDLSLDFHVDENDDPTSNALVVIAQAAIRFGYEGRVNCGHCCSLALFDEAERAKTVRTVAEAGLSIVSLPMCNLYLQDREAGRTPRWRGVTLLHELNDAGVPVSLGSDNVRDPFYAYGDLDMLEVFREGVRIGHLDRPCTEWPASVTLTPAKLMGIEGGAIAAGNPADFVIFRGRRYSEILSRHQSDRLVVRNGRQVTTALPDFECLDDLM
ncbi:cytosine deaminase (plasmid) [Rhizobium sp. NIBRBAC000502774]|nr:cytosine deaminase [Rhizobium sp. NIBRBAC000502774]